MVAWHEGFAWPSMRTVHARHWPSPHPNLAPVKPKSSRKTSSSVRRASVVTRRDWPLTVSWTLTFMMLLAFRWEHGGWTVDKRLRESVWLDRRGFGWLQIVGKRPMDVA